MEQTRGPQEEHKEQEDTSEAEQYHCSCQSSIDTNPLRGGELEAPHPDKTASIVSTDVSEVVGSMLVNSDHNHTRTTMLNELTDETPTSQTSPQPPTVIPVTPVQHSLSSVPTTETHFN